MHRALRCIPTRKVAAINLNKIYNERIAKNPGDIGAYAGWADVLSNINRTEEAAEYYITSAELASRAGKKALTKSMYEMAVQVCPSNCEANFLYGTALLADGKLSEATAYFLASSHAHNCSTTFVYSIGRLNYIYQMATEDAEKGAELQVGLDRLTAIAKRITSALEDPVFLEAKEKVMEQQDQKEKEEKKKEDEEDEKNEKGSTKSRFDVSTLGTSDEGYILIEYDDDDDENTV